MATPRRPWPEWCGAEYFFLRELTDKVIRDGGKALKIQHKNVYKTAEFLSALASDGQSIANIARQIEMNKDDSERIPNWVNSALTTAKRGGGFISAGGNHGLDGMDQDNWKMVTKGLNTCIEHAHKIKKSLLQGPAPVHEDILKTLEMGKTTSTPVGMGWRRKK